MSRVLVFALTLGMATAAANYEWKGIFYTPEASYKWGAQKVSGAYADPTMKLAAIPAPSATAAELTAAGTKGATSMGLTCEEVTSGGVITPHANKCYKLKFDQASAESLFTVNTTGVAAVAFFAEHFPTEFEDTAHYFKDTTGVDIEPQAQDPVPGSGGHSHGHGGGAGDSTEGYCVCQAQKHGWKLNCADKVKIETSVTNLEGKAVCKAKNPPQDCIDNFYVMQAHHDHCLHDQLPTGIEQKLHAYEQFYTDCFVKRQFDPKLKKCPQVKCDDQTALTSAIAKLQAGCKTAQACAATDCAASMKTVLMAHDTCKESELPNNLEVALHDHEDPCAAQLCNSADAAFDVNADKTKCLIAASRAFEIQHAFLVTTLALPLAVSSFWAC